MTYLLFVFTEVLLFGLLAAIIRWRSPLSFEGFGLLLVVPAIVGDAFGVVSEVFFDPGWVADRGIEDRVLPNVVFIIGLLALSAGLAVIDRRPRPMSRTLSPDDLGWIKQWAPLIVVLGLGMKFLALYTLGVGSLGNYLTNLGDYRTAQNSVGGFLDLGTGIALFGLSVLAAAYIRRPAICLLLVGAQIAVSFALSFSKADLVGVVLNLVIVALILVPDEMRRLARKPLLMLSIPPAALLAVVVNAGIKSQLRGLGGETDLLDFSFSNILGWAGSVFSGRFGSDGVYLGYVNLVNRITDGYAPFFDGKVLRYTLSSWVPYFIAGEKEPHPFRDVGQLFYNDYHSQATETTAPTLMGSAYVDYAFASLIVYVFAYGIILALARVLLARPGRRPFLLLAYMHFTLVDGAGNILHGGVTNLPGTMAMTSGVFGLMLIVMYLRKLLLGPQWERLEARRKWKSQARSWERSRASGTLEGVGSVGLPTVASSGVRIA